MYISSIYAVVSSQRTFVPPVHWGHAFSGLLCRHGTSCLSPPEPPSRSSPASHSPTALYSPLVSHLLPVFHWDAAQGPTLEAALGAAISRLLSSSSQLELTVRVHRTALYRSANQHTSHYRTVIWGSSTEKHARS